MDNAEKLQDVSNEAPEEVQIQAELSNENQPESEEKEVDEVEEKIEKKSQVEEKKVEEESPEAVEEKPAEKKKESNSSAEKSTTTEGAADEKSSDESSEGTEEHEEEDHDDQEEELDFDHADKEELISKIREIKNEDNIRSLDRVLKAIKPRFDELYEISKNEALQKFVSEGNEADAFEYHGDEIDKEFSTLYGQLKSKRNKHYKDLENQKEDNLKKKERLLNELREIVDGEESSNSINSVRELQSEWKKVGPVPGAMNKTLWANYNALLDRYYDNRSIYFELKDLDRKKNMKLKEELCEKAEALNKVEDMKAAIIQLNDLHDEYKHIGPVPKENQEPLWQRFKAASDAIYAKRKEYFEHLKEEFDKNLIEKEALIKEVEEFTKFNSDRITEWNSKTKEILDIQKKWEAIGGVPKEKAKATNKSFWNSFKGFFANKNQFFKELESKREENLEKKKELIEKANELKDSEDWNSTADKLKHLQTVWKDIGPVPEKVRNETYKKFKAACDHFFNKRREQNKEQFKEFEENLKLKLQICDQLEAAANADEVNLDDLYDLVDNYTSVGFVPKNAIKKIRSRFDQVKEMILSNEAIHEDDRTDLRNHIQMGRLKNTPGGDRKLHRKEHSIKRKISSIENDISTWNTNMEFFADSATADKLKADMQDKIDKAESELEDLKSQLAAISAQN
ncbi:protein of unknown function [Ekhidna lutea]|uniref:DUF349 domain-containing protein n=1 Tax=Ekhidna lutea TaxID=447679 RepID=A0A239LF47_EKHLU|nr:DUF349 domain-containing protein [Ekhidna lutea]SNT28538.1 protein of unknown function [Ekhidna lutea]